MKKYILLFMLLEMAVFNGTAQTGFSDTGREKQQELEQAYQKLLSENEIGGFIKELSARPHSLGSPRTKEIAEKINAWFKSWGWQSQIETYYVLFPTPQYRSLTLLGPKLYHAVLEEKTFVEDALVKKEGGLPPYNAWSADGDVTGGLIFVNYGLPEDYEVLDRLGISVKGKIIIAKYGKAWRGIKGQIAQEHGAIGAILYSDPADDGYTKGDSYPSGAFKNEWSVQRGSVMDMVVYPGDPLTPGTGASKDAKRLKRADAGNLLKIPVQPIGYHDAQPLLAALSGPVVPASWQGALPITYHIGNGESTVHLNVRFNWNIVPAYNVIAVLKGNGFPDQWVIRGNHHDAWVHGASDPVSGLAALLDEAKAIGKLYQNGWRPQRTLVYAAWDGEEPSLLGSTEWAEQHAKELQQKAVAYINSDNNGRGYFYAGGSHALQSFINGVAENIQDPQYPVSLLDRRRYLQLSKKNTDGSLTSLKTKEALPISALGTGSDYSAFLQHLGIPSLNLAFRGEDEGGEYHTNFDTYDDFIRFKDPGFFYAKALSEVGGLAVLRLAQAERLPFDFKDLSLSIQSYVKDLQRYIVKNNADANWYNRLLHDSVYAYTAKSDPEISNALRDTIPAFDFEPLNKSLLQLKATGEKLDAFWGLGLSAEEKNNTNEKIYQAEQQLLNESGLPNRNWYKHVIYAPGFYTGYGVKTIPGVREAIEEKQWAEATRQLRILEEKINGLNRYLEDLMKK